MQIFSEHFKHWIRRHHLETTIESLEYPIRRKKIWCPDCRCIIFIEEFDDGLENYEI